MKKNRHKERGAAEITGRRKERGSAEITGVFCANERGFGFVRREPPLRDLYIAPEDVNGALDQDTVLAVILGEEPRRRGGHRNVGEEPRREAVKAYGKVVKVVAYAAVTLVGTLQSYQSTYFVVPDNNKITTVIGVKKKNLNGARKGQKVLVEITDRGAIDNGFRKFGTVIETIGFTGQPGVDIRSVTLAHGFADSFPDEALREAAAIRDGADMRTYRWRADLRGVRLFTIDGEGSKDLDDAVSIQLLTGGSRATDAGEIAGVGAGGSVATGAGVGAGGSGATGAGDGSARACATSSDDGGICATGAGESAGVGAGGICAIGVGDGSARAGDGMCDGSARVGAMYKLGVHIADVSHYVKPNSALDREALHRGTSLYYADRVIPMLPQRISNGICSLHPHADRLALTVFMYIDADGRILSHELFESVINSTRRLTYENVYRMLDGCDAGLRAEYSDVLGDLELMRELAEKLRRRRLARGALDLSAQESVIELDADGAPIGVKAAEYTFANQLIEEFMIACNETVATRFIDTAPAFIFRTHERPAGEKLQAFMSLAGSLGLDPGHGAETARTAATASGESAPSDAGAEQRMLQRILDSARGGKYEKLVSYALLRSMAKAAYTAANKGHYGLASDCYCHFTSPIRRYPDLFIHRVIKEQLKRPGYKSRHTNSHADIDGICEACSERERAADETEREITAMKKAEYMEQFLGDDFDGVISGITSFGMFVELGNTVEGLVRLTDMRDDYYEFDERAYKLTGVNTGKSYNIGDSIEVILARTSAASRQIDFVPANWQWYS